MNPLDVFYKLKNDVLLTYQKQYPYFEGNWKTFSSQDIQNLIDLIAVQVKQTVSEKWIYTHLKVETNDKLPRKDMLDILSQLVGYSGWDEYVFKWKQEVVPIVAQPKRNNKVVFSVGFIGLFLMGIFMYRYWNREEVQTIPVKNAFTEEQINSEEVKAVMIENDVETPIEIVDSKIQITAKESAKIVLKSPYYKDKTVVLGKENPNEINLQPDDYAMMLKGFMKSDIKDWETRKEQLQKILADDLEVLVMLKNDLGIEYFNKHEFSEKLIVPSVALKRMKVIDIQSNEKNEIKFIRIIQE
ncbi:hypothetical protein [Flavobacterium proteolyticum]|uniref:Uncharacterized protein n=1 Tax=Flavobacterium proteolyticum TaxID=2911683 RepID=A0ABR9WS43_9FLAO|nr:hypothetical protein [Flavobacterium proteolyticum]MBE9576748.1 hypothetical protein [Flavobacterium proteolyticum]